MKAKDLKAEFEEFQRRLIEHSKLWGESIDRTIPDHPIRNVDTLREQSAWLSRKLGALRPFLIRFVGKLIMHHPMTGVMWNGLDASVSLEPAAQIKGSSMREVIERLHQALGQLDTHDPEDEIPQDTGQPVRPGVGVDRLTLAYLPHLHPFIAKGCSQLFADGHYAQAIEEAAKAVFQYIRNVTGLTTDGAVLVDTAFSPHKPVLAFSDLADETKKNEQVGFMEMLKGFLKGVRHPLAHSHGKAEEAQKAFEYLVMASLFCRRIDDAQPGK
jgi:uncharacterized protein (TIGR02391 family)